MEQDLEAELGAYLDLLTDENKQRGMSPAEACRSAQLTVGGVTQVKEQVREVRAGAWVETVFQDLRYALRTFRRSPVFFLVAVFTLGLGIGANTAIFSVVNAALLRSLPYPDPSRLVVLWGNVKRTRIERRGASYPDYCDWRDQSRSFAGMAAFDEHPFALTGIDVPERIQPIEALRYE